MTESQTYDTLAALYRPSREVEQGPLLDPGDVGGRLERHVYAPPPLAFAPVVSRVFF